MEINTDNELAYAIDKMRTAGTDLSQWELKTATGGFPKSTAETMSAFANTNGGTIIFGMSEKDFKPSSDLDIKTLQAKCAQAARELIHPPLQIDLNVLSFEGTPVLVANIPELSPRQKPCYVKKLGQLGGSYIRTGDGDHKLSLYEIDRFIENQTISARNDATVVAEATKDDLDDDLVQGWLQKARMSSFGRTSRMSDDDLLAAKRVIAPDDTGVFRPTVAGLLSMGSYPQKFFPRLNVIFTSYPRTKRGETSASGNRFSDSLNIDGSIPEMLATSIQAVSRNMKHGAIIKGALREDVPDYPFSVIRETVANALMHRDYSNESHGTPVQIDLFPDRLEITNPGGLYGSLTVDSLGMQGATASRNQFLATILADVPYTDYDGSKGQVVENRGSGYPTITGELEKALMSKPVILNNLNEFKIILRHRGMTEQESIDYSRTNVEEAILDYFAKHESASNTEISNAAGIATKTSRTYINKLMNEGILEGIGSKNNPKRRYRLTR